jgi:leucyl aminopeptidase (aminopeptidase T)
MQKRSTPSIDHCSRWPRARSCRITTSPGTDVAFGLRGRGGHADDGDLRRRGAFGNLPAGEAYIAPIESTGEGTLVLDGSLAGHGLIGSPLRIELAGGRIVAADGEVAEWLLGTLDAGGEGGRTLAELGIGVNPGARITGIVVVDEKALGTAHLAFGTNVSFGGASAAGVHIDGVIRAPTVELDGEPLLEDGRLAIHDRR